MNTNKVWRGWALWSNKFCQYIDIANDIVMVKADSYLDETVECVVLPAADYDALVAKVELIDQLRNHQPTTPDDERQWIPLLLDAKEHERKACELLERAPVDEGYITWNNQRDAFLAARKKEQE